MPEKYMSVPSYTPKSTTLLNLFDWLEPVDVEFMYVMQSSSRYISDEKIRIFQSEIFVIEDCYSYDPNNYTSTTLSSLTIPNGDFELTYKSILKSNDGHNTNLNIYGVLNDGTTQVISVIGIGKHNSAGWHLSFVTNGNWDEHCFSNSKGLNIEYTVKYTYVNGVHSLYLDNVLLGTATKIMLNMHDVWVGITQNEYIKELKVKPL